MVMTCSASPSALRASFGGSVLAAEAAASIEHSSTDSRSRTTLLCLTWEPGKTTGFQVQYLKQTRYLNPKPYPDPQPYNL